MKCGFDARLSRRSFITNLAGSSAMLPAFFVRDRRGNLRLPESVHAAFIYINARLFLRVRRIKRQGVAPWQRRRRARKKNRRREPRLEHREFDVAKRPDRCSAVCLSCSGLATRIGRARGIRMLVHRPRRIVLVGEDS